MTIKDIVIKSEWKDKKGIPRKKYHNAGVLFVKDDGSMYGSLRIFGHDIRFSIYDRKEKTSFGKTFKEGITDETPF